MKGDHIKYCAGYKYQLVEEYGVQTNILGKEFDHPFFSLRRDGWLTIKKWYAWDGCSGPTKDTKSNMRCGLVHDVLYQAMRLGLLPQGDYLNANEMLEQIFEEDSTWLDRLLHRPQYYYEGVKLFGHSSAALGAEPYPIHTAP